MGVAKNTAINMAEDLTMMVGYSMVNQYLHERLAEFFPPEYDENGNEKMNIALEVFSGGASFLFMSAMMEVIRREERFIEYLFAGVEAVITVLWARNKGYFDGMINKMKSTKGFKTLARSKIFSANTDPTNSFIGQVYAAAQTIIQGRNASDNVASTIQASNSSQDTAIRREAHNLKFAELNNKSFSNSIFIKTATGTFTPADKTMLQKMIGRSDFATVPLNVDELNKMHEFLYVQSSDGKFHGLTDSITSLVNGLGFLK